MQKVVLNFLAGEKVHFVDDHEINPIAHADAFVDPEATHANAEDVLARARMILATELGKDPLLRQEMRNLFKSDGLVSVLPTEKGLATITDTSPLFVS
jgi:transcription elongation factor SPT6